MPVTIKEVQTPADIREFVNLPFRIYKNNPYWVPPLKAGEKKSLQKEYNPAFEFCKAKFWLAFLEGKCIGRIGGIINSAYIEKSGEMLGRFTRPEFIDDTEVSSKLFLAAEEWAKKEGMNGMQGPLGFTNLDHQGLLVEGFDHLPSIASEYHLPYYQKHIENLGYKKEMDWVEFRLTISGIPEKAVKLNELIKKRYELSVLNFTGRKQMKPYAMQLFQVLNEAFSDLYSMVRLNDRMIQYYSDRYFNFLNPEFVKIILDKGKKVVGFIIGLPSLSRAMQKANGSLFPFGFWHITQALKHPSEVDLMLTGIHPKLQGTGVPALLITELQKTILKYGVKYVETTGMIETNQKAIQHWKNYEHIQHKRKRAYIKLFNS